jgi:glucose/arabinose dehydrogenase
MNPGCICLTFTSGFTLPNGYDGAEHFYLKGTQTNDTHYTVNALCKGCTGWVGNDETRTSLPFNGTTEFAWAYGASAVEDPARNTSAFNVHAETGKWFHDLNAARIDDFDELVNVNMLKPPVASSSAPAIPSSTIASTTASNPASTPMPTATPTDQPEPPATIPASCPDAGNPTFQGKLASGWKATKIAGGLTNPRSIQFDSAGNMLVVENSKGISHHTLDADGCVTATKILVSSNALNHGIAMSHDGKTLYASSMTQVYSWPYDAAAGTVGTRQTIVTGMYNGGTHFTRTLALHPTNPNLLVVSHGSNSNLDDGALSPSSAARAIIKVFDLSKIPSGGYNYISGGWNAGYGQRNEVGITFDNNGHLWGVENSADDIHRNDKDVHHNNPGEKIHYMGDVTKPNDDWYGYPTCFTVWQPSDFTDKQFQVGDWFVQSPNSTFNDDTCKERAVAPKLTLFPHSAPIDCKFDADNANMYITYHGSWNRAPTTGFKVVAVPFKKGEDGNYTPVAPLSSNDAAQDIFWNPDVENCQGNGPFFSSGCFRPAGLAFDKAGRLFMTSDTSTNGELWILGKS